MLPHQVCQLPCFCTHILWRLICENEQIIRVSTMATPLLVLWITSSRKRSCNCPPSHLHQCPSALPVSILVYPNTSLQWALLCWLQTWNLNVHNRDLCLAYTASNGYWMPQGSFPPGELTWWSWFLQLGRSPSPHMLPRVLYDPAKEGEGDIHIGGKRSFRE